MMYRDTATGMMYRDNPPVGRYASRETQSSTLAEQHLTSTRRRSHYILIDSSVSSSYIRQLRTVTTIIYTARKRHCKFCGI
jgi:hypothetical protein